MGSIPFPFEISIIAAFESQMPNLSLEEIEEITEQALELFLNSSEKTKDYIENFLISLDQKREKLVQYQINLLNADGNPASKIEKLKKIIYYLSPDEIDLQLRAIELENLLLEDSFNQEMIRKELAKIRFREKYPIAKDLVTFCQKIKKLADQIRGSNSLYPLNELSLQQWKEIESMGRIG